MLCDQSNFLAFRMRDHNKMLFYGTKFCGNLKFISTVKAPRTMTLGRAVHRVVRREARMQKFEERVGCEEERDMTHEETIVGGSNWRVTEESLGGFLSDGVDWIDYRTRGK